jgi:hypothetical protein
LITVCHGDRCLPRQLIERAEKEENPSPWTALDVMIAAAIELLLTCPAHWERRAARHRPPLHMARHRKRPDPFVGDLGIGGQK